MDTFYDVVTAAVNDLVEHGYDSTERVAAWEKKIREAAEREMKPIHQMEQSLREALASIYRRMVERGRLLNYHPGIERFTLDKVRHSLRAELDRRIMASANLIRLNREEAIHKTLRRFSGWSTSIPKGGSEAVDKKEEKKDLRRSLTSLPFVERRVLIDQGHKMTASLNNILATDGGAIALVWRSNWRQPGYHYRKDHKERDLNVYAIRNSWAHQKGLLKAGPYGWYDEITAVAEEPYCRCYAIYLYSLSKLPSEMLTRQGTEALREARERLAA